MTRTMNKNHNLTEMKKTEFRQTWNKSMFERYAKEPYAEVYKYEETNSVTLFTKKTYKFAVSFGLNWLRMNPTSNVFNTRVGPSLLWKDLAETDWLPSIRPCDSPRLQSATNQNLKVVGTIVLLLRSVGSRIRIMLGSKTWWSLSSFASCSMIGFKGHLPQRAEDSSVQIHTHASCNGTRSGIWQDRRITRRRRCQIVTEQDFTQELVQVAHTIRIKSLTETSVLGATNAKRIVQIDDFTQFEQSYSSKVAHGVIEVFSRSPLYVLVANASTFVIMLAAYQHGATGNPTPSDILYVTNDKCSRYPPPSSTADSVNAVHYKPTRRSSATNENTKLSSKLTTTALTMIGATK